MTPAPVEQQRDELLRFAKRIAEYPWSAHEAIWAQEEAEELLVLYGNPDARKPVGVLNA